MQDFYWLLKKHKKLSSTCIIHISILYFYTHKIIRRIKKKMKEASKSTCAGMQQLSYAMAQHDFTAAAWYQVLFFYHFCRGLKQAEPILNSGGKMQQTTDMSETIVTCVTRSYKGRFKYDKLSCYISAVLCLAAFTETKFVSLL